MLKAIYIIILLLASTMGLTAQNNLIVCGQVDPDWDVYYNIEPDTSLQPIITAGPSIYARYYFDMDQNGTNDFIIFLNEMYAPSGGILYIQLIGNNCNKIVGGLTVLDSCPTEIVGGQPIEWEYDSIKIPMKLNYGDTIDFRQQIDDTVLHLTLVAPWTTETALCSLNAMSWIGIGEKYIGVSMQVNDVTLYGWILVEVTDYSSVTVKEFACNKNPYIGITPNQATQAFELYPNPAKNEVFIKLNGKNNGKSGTFALYDLSGKKLMHAEDIPKNGRIALPALAKGLYVAEIEVEGQKYSRKLQIE